MTNQTPATQNRTHFVASHERLIAISAKDGHSAIFDDILDTVEDATRLITTEAEFISQIIRIDTITLQAQDVSEEIAEVYIRLFGDDLNEESTIDPFLEVSQAWEDHIEYLAQQAADDARFGTYEEQHRLTLKDVL